MTTSAITRTTDNAQRNATAVADPEARELLRKADPVLAQVIDAHPDFHPRAWIDELPPFDAFGTVVALFEDAGFFVVDLGGLREGGQMQQVGAPLAGHNLIRLR